MLPYVTPLLLTPPSPSQLQAWYLVVSTFAQQNRRRAAKVDSASQKRMFENCATMALGELARDPDLTFYKAHQIAQSSAKQVISDFELSPRIIDRIQI